jgi:SPP1 family phage portal protein
MVDWKLGYVFGNPIKYAQSKSTQTDDITYLHKYFRSVSQRSIDKEVGKWAYATGVGYYFVEPRSDNFDVLNEAPYKIYHIDSDKCSKVYSSYYGEGALFDLIYTTYEESKGEVSIKSKVQIVEIYTETDLYTFEKRVGEDWKLTEIKARGFAKPLPLVEKRLNSDGIGIVAMGRDLQNALNTLISNGIDNVEEMVNEIFVYTNVDLGENPTARHRQMRKDGAIGIASGANGVPASVTTLSPKSSLSQISELFEMINQKFHSSLGVPMEMSNTNSGNTTKSGSEVANGYDNAYNHALDDINSFIVADTELLNKIMWICTNTKGNPINNLHYTDIEIKYWLNLTDNIQIKSQAFGTFIQYMPPEKALAYTRLSNDPEADGKLIRESEVYRAFLAKQIGGQSTNNNSQE